MVAAGLWALLVPAGLAVAQADGDAADTLSRARVQGVLRVGYANEAPFAYMDSRANRLTGEAPEIARVILARLGIDRVEGVLTEFGALIPGLQAGRFDMIAAGMYVLPARCSQILFSQPTYGVGEALLERSDRPTGLRSYADAALRDDVRLGVVVGAVQSAYADDAGIPPARRIVFPDVVSAVEGVLAGRADVYAATSLTVNHVLARVPDWPLQPAPGFVQPQQDGEAIRGYGAFGFRRGDRALKEAVDRELARYLGTDAHLALVAPFGFTRAELPGAARTDILCQPRDAAVPPEGGAAPDGEDAASGSDEAGAP